MHQIRRNLQLEDGVAEVLLQGHADRRISRQRQNTLVLLRQPQFFLRTDHAFARHAANRARFQRDPLRFL